MAENTGLIHIYQKITSKVIFDVKIFHFSLSTYFIFSRDVVMYRTLHLGKLPEESMEDDIAALFPGFRIQTISISPDNSIGFVKFQNRDAAEKAKSYLSQQRPQLYGHVVQVT
jgi:hypothetical protein